MTMTHFRRMAPVVLTALVVFGCGGGGGGGGNSAPQGIDRGGVTIAQGPISGFGSIFVNGVEYATTGAMISVDGQPGSESDLRVGQMVRVEGSVNQNGTTGTATRVTYADDVEGPIQSIDLPAKRMVVVGQVVQTGPGTSFDQAIVPSDLSGLAVGDRVEVSGTVTSQGVINATRVERKGAASSVEVKGVIAALDTNAHQFSLGALVVNYATAQLAGFAGGQPANGDTVEAVGTLNGAGTLVATQLEKQGPGAPGGNDDKADFEGLVTRFVSPADFDVAGQRATTTAFTVYEGGSAADLALDVQVEVEGTFDTMGRIVATKVAFRHDGDTEFSAPVESVNVAGNSLVMLGTTVRTNNLTRFEDKSAARLQHFSLADIHVGDYLEVRAYDDGSGLLATVLERKDVQGTNEVVGIATAIAPPNFVVAGIPVTTDANTEFRDNNGVTVSASTFFAIASGRTVKVRGTLTGNTLLAERAELDD